MTPPEDYEQVELDPKAAGGCPFARMFGGKQKGEDAHANFHKHFGFERDIPGDHAHGHSHHEENFHVSLV
jgi:hypothetical protein